ncbi:hypothetical protein DL95DRAFT_417595 [Leptodontidium sp. 2 PMI_412]|nr:hypothetical protein DL95DRAFT_417595 [Leptodontidium sp. 2 PMI_412]
MENGGEYPTVEWLNLATLAGGGLYNTYASASTSPPAELHYSSTDLPPNWIILKLSTCLFFPYVIFASMPPKRARNRAIKRPKATKTTTPRTPLSLTPGPAKITLKINTTKVVELEIRYYLDNERISSTIRIVINDPEVNGSTYKSIKRNVEQLADRGIVERVPMDLLGTLQRLILGMKLNSNTSSLELGIGDLKKEPSAPKPPVIAIPKRVFQEEESHTVKKPRTATNRLLKEVKKTHEAEKGTFQLILTSIQSISSSTTIGGASRASKTKGEEEEEAKEDIL